MQLKASLLFGVTAIFSINNCAGYRTAANYPEPRPLGKDYKTYHAPAEISKEDTSLLHVEEPKGTLTLRQALSLALLKNPELAAFSWEVRARQARARQAALLPNPQIEVELENFGGSGDAGGFKQTESTILLSQLIELGGKRRKRTRVAVLESDLAAWDFEIKRLDILTDVTQAFLDVRSVQDRLALDIELVRLAAEFVDIVSQRVQVGRTSPAEESRARVALSNAQIGLGRSQRERESARQRLAATWGSLTPQFQQVTGNLGLSQSIPEIDQLLKLTSQNPEIARWVVKMQQRRAVVELQEAQRIPDPAIGGGIRRLAGSDDNAFVLDLAIPIPIFNRNQGAATEARLRSNKAEFERQATELRITTLVVEFYRALSTAFNEASSLQTSVLPEAQKAFDTISDGYKQGKFGFLDVLDAQRTLFDSRGQYLRALTDYHKATADLERLIGQSLDTIQ
ncbi:MAG: TolC family protein [Calditrichaeota bacterium]|nr:TolC family protein [Calditrichota bacterium]